LNSLINMVIDYQTENGIWIFEIEDIKHAYMHNNFDATRAHS